MRRQKLKPAEQSNMNRRDFIKTAACATSALAIPQWVPADERKPTAIPSYLAGYETAYAKDPRAAATLRDVGRRIREQGFPARESVGNPVRKNSI
jgi:hypothetical protein